MPFVLCPAPAVPLCWVRIAFRAGDQDKYSGLLDAAEWNCVPATVSLSP